jgi:hypothetical protein
MEDCHPFFRYLIFFIIFLIGFFCMFIKNIELIGIGIVFVINIINSYFLGIDILNHPSVERGEITFMVIIFISLAFLFVSSILIMITLKDLHATYSKMGSKIKMSAENRKKYSKYKIIFMLCIIFIGILSLIYFLQPSEYDFFRIVYGTKYYIVLSILLALIKYGLSAAVLGLSAYSVYLSNDLAHLPNMIIQ